MDKKVAAYILLSAQIILSILFFAPFIGGEMPLVGTLNYSFYNIVFKLNNLYFYTMFLLQLVNFVLLLTILYRFNNDIKSKFLTFIIPVNYIVTAIGCFFAKYTYLDDKGNPIFNTLWGAIICGVVSLVLLFFSLVLCFVTREYDSCIDEENEKERTDLVKEVLIQKNKLEDLNKELNKTKINYSNIETNLNALSTDITTFKEAKIRLDNKEITQEQYDKICSTLFKN